MKKLLIAVLLTAMTLSGTAIAQRQPANMPPEGFMTIGPVDAIFPEENRIVIGDIPYRLSDSVTIHTTSASGVSFARLRVGVMVGIKFGDSEVIRELWILPKSYKDPRRS